MILVRNADNFVYNVTYFYIHIYNKDSQLIKKYSLFNED